MNNSILNRDTKTKKIAKLLLVFAVLLLAQFHSSAQIQDKPYNRVQYYHYKWKTFHTSAFSIYFPIGYDSLCSYIAKETPTALALVKLRTGSELSKQPAIIIYPSTDQLYETNIGAFENQSFTLPTFVIKGTRILLAYNGNHEELKAQLREALMRATWELQFKDDLGEQVKRTVIDDKIPFWFSEGAIRYFANDWTIQTEDALRKSFNENKFQNWDDIIAYEPRLSGQAFCYFLTQHYYSQALFQLWFQLKKKKSLPRAIRLIAKHPLDTVTNQSFEFYQKRFQKNQQNDPTISINKSSITIPHKKGITQNIIQSNNQKQIAYTTTSFNKRTVWIYDTITKKTTKIYTYQLPPWLNDHSKDEYPLIEWNKEKELIITTPEKGNITIKRFNATGNKLQENDLFGVDGIGSIEPYAKNEWLLSAYRQGQTDIVIYNDRKEKYKALTDDNYDDQYPTRNETTNEIAFISNRPVLVGKNQYDQDSFILKQGVFILQQEQIKPLLLDTFTAKQTGNIANKETKPTWLNNQELLLTNSNTGQERMIDYNKGQSTILNTNKPYQYNPITQQISFANIEKDSIEIISEPINNWIKETKANEEDTTSPWLNDYRKMAAAKAKEDSILNAAKSTEPSFLEGVLVPKNARERSIKRKDSILRSLQYDPKKIRDYILELHSAYFTAKVNNDYFINRYQPYLNYQGQFKFPEVGGMARGGFTDMFENHNFSIAYRMPAGSDGSDFFVKYENTKKKTDWSVLWFRKVESLKPDPNREWKDENGNTYPSSANVKTNYFELAINHPLNYYLGFTFSTALRDDRTVFLATDTYSLHFDDIKSDWSITTIAANFNKLQTTLPTLFKGFKAKLTADIFKGFSQNKDALYGLSLDIQYHQPIYKYITFFQRIQIGHSGGNTKLLYNMGGVDNNLTIRTDTSVHFSQNAPYAFQTLITPLRGYLQNSLYGNQYLLFNTDVYFPIFQTLIPIETPLQFVNNLLLGLFTDIAYTSETWKFPRQNNNVFSYGLSARTTLAGYPIRVDVAVPESLNKTFIWYLSLSLK